MASNAATPVPAEAEQFSRQEVATSDRLWNRERQSLSQATQLASKLNLDHPGMVHAVKHDACLTTAHGSQERHTYIIFDRATPTANRTTKVETKARSEDEEYIDQTRRVAHLLYVLAASGSF